MASAITSMVDRIAVSAQDPINDYSAILSSVDQNRCFLLAMSSWACHKWRGNAAKCKDAASPLTDEQVVRLAVAAPDIPARNRSSKDLRLVSSPFEQWAHENGYNTSPAVSPAPTRVYADSQTQAAFDAWDAGAADVARMVTESTLETEALREKLLAIAVSE